MIPRKTPIKTDINTENKPITSETLKPNTNLLKKSLPNLSEPKIKTLFSIENLFLLIFNLDKNLEFVFLKNKVSLLYSWKSIAYIS